MGFRLAQQVDGAHRALRAEGTYLNHGVMCKRRPCFKQRLGRPCFKLKLGRGASGRDQDDTVEAVGPGWAWLARPLCSDARQSVRPCASASWRRLRARPRQPWGSVVRTLDAQTLDLQTFRFSLHHSQGTWRHTQTLVTPRMSGDRAVKQGIRLFISRE